MRFLDDEIGTKSRVSFFSSQSSDYFTDYLCVCENAYIVSSPSVNSDDGKRDDKRVARDERRPARSITLACVFDGV